jgi:hypothetical protein
LESSLRNYGAGRSILIDRDNRIIAGNKTVESAVDIGLKDLIVVETDGTQLVAVKRVDLTLDEEPARQLAYADNRVAELDLSWDVDVIVEDLAQGVDLSEFFTDEEISAMGTEQLSEQKQVIKPMQKFHVLISVPLDSALDLKDFVSELEGQIAGVEIAYGSNG